MYKPTRKFTTAQILSQALAHDWSNERLVSSLASDLGHKTLKDLGELEQIRTLIESPMFSTDHQARLYAALPTWYQQSLL